MTVGADGRGGFFIKLAVRCTYYDKDQVSFLAVRFNKDFDYKMNAFICNICNTII